MRTHTCGELREEHAGQEVTLCGWVETLRIAGKIGFLIIRDRYGTTQCFLNKDLVAEFKDTRRESCVRVTGLVKERPDNQKKPEPTGGIELSVTNMEVLSMAKPLPMELDESIETGEDTRLKYRYLDLRKERMTRNLVNRSKAIRFIHNFLQDREFVEVTTPMLTKSTPEGARDFLVPSRVFNGKFFALPQSPQQYKQLLMVAGLDRYYQVAPCFRDEDARADRSPGEFYQLDLEMSFAEQDDILALIEELYIKLVETVFPEKKFTQVPFPRLTYDEAMEKYGTDKPDLRKNKDDPNELSFVWVVDFPLFEPELEDGHFAPMHHMFTRPKDEDLDKLESDPGSVKSYQHDLVLNGYEVGGGSVRIHDADVQQKIFDLIGFSKEESEYFSHMLEAFSYGVPPHGGIAPGIDRTLMILCGEPNIREVIAFPKNKDARDVLMDAPAEVFKTQLDDLGIEVTQKHK